MRKRCARPDYLCREKSSQNCFRVPLTLTLSPTGRGDQTEHAATHDTQMRLPCDRVEGKLFGIMPSRRRGRKRLLFAAFDDRRQPPLRYLVVLEIEGVVLAL